MAEYGSLTLLSRCVEAVTGLNAQSQTSETTAEETLVTDECGENAKLLTKNVTSTHEFEGQIKGSGATGIVAAKVGVSFAAPGGIWLENMAAPGAVNVLSNGRYNAQAGEYASFMGRLTNRAGI